MSWWVICIPIEDAVAYNYIANYRTVRNSARNVADILCRGDCYIRWHSMDEIYRIKKCSWVFNGFIGCAIPDHIYILCNCAFEVATELHHLPHMSFFLCCAISLRYGTARRIIQRHKIEFCVLYRTEMNDDNDLVYSSNSFDIMNWWIYGRFMSFFTFNRHCSLYPLSFCCSDLSSA